MKRFTLFLIIPLILIPAIAYATVQSWEMDNQAAFYQELL